MNMTGKELAQLIKDGIHPLVTFTDPILNAECYLEPGMRGRLVSISEMTDEMFKLHIDVSEFEDFNRPFETANYFDKSGNPCLTAREAGFFKGTEETNYVGLDDKIDFFVLEEPNRLAVYEAYSKSESKLTYVQWMEDRVMHMEEILLIHGLKNEIEN